MRKILFFCGSGYYGGAVKSGTDVARFLTEGYDIDLTVILPSKHTTAPVFDRHGVKYLIIPHTMAKTGVDVAREKVEYRKLEERGMRLLENCVDLSSVDLIYTNTDSVFLALKVAKKHGIPCVAHLREFGEENDSKTYLVDNGEELLTQYDHYIAISQAVKDYYVGRGVDPNKITVVYNGLPLYEWRMNDISSLTRQDKINILMSGRIEKCKRQVDAVKAISKLPDAVKNMVSLDIYGNGGNLAEVLRTIDENDLRKNVHYKGEVFSMNKYTNGYSIGLMCSNMEAFGRVTAEYMACGMCPVVSDGGANQELVRHMENGLVYRCGDVEGLAKAIEWLCTNKSELVRLGCNAYNSSHLYDINRCVKEIHSVLCATARNTRQ